MFTQSLFDNTKNKLDCYREKDCMNNFCKNVNDHVMEIINYGKKEKILLTSEENKSNHEEKVCHISKKKFSTDDKKLRDHCHFTGKNRVAARNICNLNHKSPKKFL